jgi:hypothetical protein
LGHSFNRDPGATCPREDRLSGEPCGAPVFEFVDAATYRGAVDRIADLEAENARLQEALGWPDALDPSEAESPPTGGQ